jgi:drug/metabolite transporter superfamily protein YnfA
MTTLRAWIVTSWIAFPGVMLGGTLLLRRVTLGDPSEFQVTWLRAFHAHGGVLFVLSLLYFLFLDRTVLPGSVKRLACLALFAGIGGIAGGFLLQALIGQPQRASIGIVIVIGGAILMATAIIVLVYGLIKAPSSSLSS